VRTSLCLRPASSKPSAASRRRRITAYRSAKTSIADSAADLKKIGDAPGRSVGGTLSIRLRGKVGANLQTVRCSAEVQTFSRTPNSSRAFCEELASHSKRKTERTYSGSVCWCFVYRAPFSTSYHRRFEVPNLDIFLSTSSPIGGCDESYTMLVCDYQSKLPLRSSLLLRSLP
jgi:hypothetical protein